MRKLLAFLSVMLFAVVFLPVSTYAAPAHTTKHTTKHTTHKAVHTAKKTKQTKKTTKKTTKKQQKKQKPANVSVQGTSQYVTVGSMTVQKEVSWADLMKQGPTWLNYSLAHDQLTWHDPANY